jgi:hypothetical protein
MKNTKIIVTDTRDPRNKCVIDMKLEESHRQFVARVRRIYKPCVTAKEFLSFELQSSEMLDILKT